MARVTVSLPDALMTQLDDYATQHASSVSEVVQVALKALFAGAPAPAPAPPPPTPPPAPPAPPPPDAHQAERFQRLEDYVAAMSYEVEHMRQGLWVTSCFLAHHAGVQAPCSLAISEPPWPNQPPGLGAW